MATSSLPFLYPARLVSRPLRAPAVRQFLRSLHATPVRSARSPPDRDGQSSRAAPQSRAVRRDPIPFELPPDIERDLLPNSERELSEQDDELDYLDPNGHIHIAGTDGTDSTITPLERQVFRRIFRDISHRQRTDQLEQEMYEYEGGQFDEVDPAEMESYDQDDDIPMEGLESLEGMDTNRRVNEILSEATDDQVEAREYQRNLRRQQGEEARAAEKAEARNVKLGALSSLGAAGGKDGEDADIMDDKDWNTVEKVRRHKILEKFPPSLRAAAGKALGIKDGEPEWGVGGGPAVGASESQTAQKTSDQTASAGLEAEAKVETEAAPEVEPEVAPEAEPKSKPESGMVDPYAAAIAANLNVSGPGDSDTPAPGSHRTIVGISGNEVTTTASKFSSRNVMDEDVRREQRELELAMLSCKSDFQLWEFMEQKVFTIPAQVGLLRKPGGRGAKGVDRVGNKKLPVRGPLYPALLLHGQRLLASHFAGGTVSPLTFSVIPRVKQTGLEAFVLGASTPLFNHLMGVRWLRQGDPLAVFGLLSEMQRAGVIFDQGTLNIVKSIMWHLLPLIDQSPLQARGRHGLGLGARFPQSTAQPYMPLGRERLNENLYLVSALRMMPDLAQVASKLEYWRTLVETSARHVDRVQRNMRHIEPGAPRTLHPLE